MLFAIDIGNTNMEFGIFDGQKLIANFRLGTNKDITSDEVGLFTTQFFMIQGIQVAKIEDVIITSVVPQVMYSISNAIRKYFGKEPLIVGENVEVQIENLYDHPREVGADRLVNAVAGFRKYGGPQIIVDFGTATTFDAIDGQGRYLGGVIYPGIRISMDALFQNAAKLPRIEIVNPGKVIGTNTVESMQAGAVHGYVGAVCNITQKISEELGGNVKIIATGGLSRMIGKVSGIFEAIDKTLTLDGLRMIYEDTRQSGRR